MSLRRRSDSSNTAVLEEEKPPFEIEDADTPTDDPGVVPIAEGWEAAENNRVSDSKYAERLKLGESPVLVKFLTDSPITWKQHFIQSTGKPYVCLKADRRGCPLCDIGDVPRPRHMMSVADLSGDEAIVKKLEFGNRLLGDLKSVHEGPKGPLTRFCVRLSSRGKGYDVAYTVDVVKDRDLEEEEEITPADVAEAIKDLEPLTTDAIYMSKYEDLAEVAESLV